MSENHSQYRRLIAALPWIALTAALTLVFFLGSDVRVLRPQAAELKRRKMMPWVGQYVPTVRARSLDGREIIIGETTKGRKQLLFFFTASCPYCRQTVPQWKQVHDAVLRDSNLDVLWISFSSGDSSAMFSREHNLEVPIWRFDDRKARHLFRVKLVPTALVINHEGQITHLQPGVLASAAARDSLIRAASGSRVSGTSISARAVSVR